MKQIGLPICLSKNTPPNKDVRDVGGGPDELGEDDSYLRAGDGATRRIDISDYFFPFWLRRTAAKLLSGLSGKRN